MERNEVIAQAAALWARQLPPGGQRGEAWDLYALCAAHRLNVATVGEGRAILGGAYARLQLWDWANPSGGIIWVRGDLEPVERAFAIAHELGHYALHRGEGVGLHPPCEPRDVDELVDAAELRTQDHRVEEYTPRARRELEANAFAAELLAPCEVVRGLFTAGQGVDASALAARLGIAPTLASRRLVDAVLAPRRVAAARAEVVASGSQPAVPTALLGQLDDDQRTAARTPGPVLVVAGPGTGKTATLVGRAAHLVLERGVPAEHVLALTFSNRAAGEMRERVISSGLPGGERMPIMTLHAFAGSLLREYAPRVPHGPGEPPLAPDFRILDETDEFLLLEELLGELPLRYYRSLGNPTAHVRTLLADFSRARDGLLTPGAYLNLVEGMAEQARRAPGGPYTEEDVARARERAEAYGVWDRELRRRGVVDFGGLILRAVEQLQVDAAVLTEIRQRYPEVLVDEFQDTNHAAAELLFAVAGALGGGPWVVGDRNQSIYRWRGASPANLPRLVRRYPHLLVRRLGMCYRSVPAIVQLGSVMAARMAALAPGVADGAADGAAEDASPALREALRPLELQPVRAAVTGAAIQREERFESATHERLGLAAVIHQQRERGARFADQAVLVRTRKQARQIAAVFASQGVPATQQGDFFARDEIKDALMLLLLAAGPDARGVLRAGPLLRGLGYPQPSPGELARAAVVLSRQPRRPLPGALRDGAALRDVPGLAPATREGLAALGEVATQMRNGSTVGLGLAGFLLRPGGYAWRLACVADGRDQPGAPDAGAEPLPAMPSPARAQQALAALGELVRLAWRFDLRWWSEPEFRARLSRVVTHRRAPTPDALDSFPGADVAADDHPGHPDAAPQAQPSAPAVRCFLHQVGAMRAAEASVLVPPTEEDAVHLLTLHQSKGLEFPIVYLPGLAQGQFPQSHTNRDPVCPPGFRESDVPGEDEVEERCLLYVGVTRARDHVAFTRAQRYGSAPTTRPSVLLGLVEGFGDQPGDAALLPERELTRLAAEAATASGAEEEDDAEAADGSPAPGHAGAKPVFDLHDLEQYIECPLQFKYASVYGLLDPAENAVRRFHRYIRRGMEALRDLRAAAPATAWPVAEARLQALWETHGPAGSAYDAFYWQAAQEILRTEWQAITSAEGAGQAGRTLLAQTLRAELAHCCVDVTADRQAQEALPGDAPNVALTVLVRLHTGRPRAAHKNDLRLPLYYLAHQQDQPGAPLRIALAYVGAPLRANGDPVSDPPPGAIEDVTEEAQTVAEEYLRPGRKRRSRLDKLDDAARGIAAGQFAPRPAEERCAACAFCYVCPADSAEVVPSAMLARAEAGPRA